MHKVTLNLVWGLSGNVLHAYLQVHHDKNVSFVISTWENVYFSNACSQKFVIVSKHSNWSEVYIFICRHVAYLQGVTNQEQTPERLLKCFFHENTKASSKFISPCENIRKSLQSVTCLLSSTGWKAKTCPYSCIQIAR